MSRQMRPLSQRLLLLQRCFSSTAYVQDASSHAETLSYLKHIDSIALAATKRQVSAIGTEAQNLSALTNSIISSAGHIQINPSIPPYKPRKWAQHQNTFPPKLTNLLERVEHLRLNLDDLEFIPYPEERGESISQKFRAQLGAGSEQDKLSEAQNLKFEEEAHGRRLDSLFETVEQEVEAWRAKRHEGEAGTYKPVFKKVALGSAVQVEPRRVKVNSADVIQTNGKGWGENAIAKAEVENKAVNAFPINKIDGLRGVKSAAATPIVKMEALKAALDASTTASTTKHHTATEVQVKSETTSEPDTKMVSVSTKKKPRISKLATSSVNLQGLEDTMVTEPTERTAKSLSVAEAPEHKETKPDVVAPKSRGLLGLQAQLEKALKK